MRLFQPVIVKEQLMNNKNPLIQIVIDPLNPAQVFGCCGILELLSATNPEVLACFHQNPKIFRTASFQILGAGIEALKEILSALKRARIASLDGFPGGEAPVKIDIDGVCGLTLDWWLVPERTKKSRLKLWAGQQTTLKLVRDMLIVDWGDLGSEVFQHHLPMSGRFGLDPRSAWNTLDFGSSPNTQGRDAYTYPAAEMLSAIGLQGFRPRSINRNIFSYRLWKQPMPLVCARAALSGALFAESPYALSFQVEKRSGSYSCFTFAQIIKQ
jgi:hypothetical protein